MTAREGRISELKAVPVAPPLAAGNTVGKISLMQIMLPFPGLGDSFYDYFTVVIE